MSFPFPRPFPGPAVADGRINLVRNSSGQGAVTGSPGTPPTNWSTVFQSGLTRTIVGRGVLNGIDYVDIQISGTPASTGVNTIQFEPATQIAAVTGQVETVSAYMAIVAGGTTNVSVITFRNQERSSGGSVLMQNAGPDFKGALTSTMSRQSLTTTMSNASTAFVSPLIAFSATNTTTPIDITLRIGLPQIEFTSAPTPPIRTP